MEKQESKVPFTPNGIIDIMDNNYYFFRDNEMFRPTIDSEISEELSIMKNQKQNKVNNTNK